MQNTKKIFRLQGKIQHYTWGGTEFIRSLLRQPSDPGLPCAELWLGAHQNAPSEVIVSDTERVALDQFIRRDPAEILGEAATRQFGRLPYLLKVLDVKDMLSIQVHPSRQAALREFEAENKRGIALNDPSRNYKDDNHKPELMLALSPFWLLHGFKPAVLLKQTLAQVQELSFLLPVFAEGDYRTLYKTVMEMNQPEVNARLEPLIQRILPAYESGTLDKDGEDFWAARAFKTFCTPDRYDRGLFSIYLFNLLHLQPGEAIFQDAGILHAYLEGRNIEIMANSDNVLRGGLTNKHVDVAELLKHVVFEPVEPHIIKGTKLPESAEWRFATPAPDFELRMLPLAANEEADISTRSAGIFLVLEGKAEAGADKDLLQLQQGEAMLAKAGSSIHWRAVEATRIFHALVPYAHA